MSRKLVGRQVRKHIVARHIDNLKKDLRESKSDSLPLIIYAVVGVVSVVLAFLFRI